MMPRHRASWGAVITFGILVTCLPFEVQTARAEDLTDEQWAANQQVLDVAANAITGGKEDLELRTIPGFGSLAYDVPKLGIRLRWKGTPPSEVTTAIAAAEAQGVLVTLVPTARTLNDALNAQTALADQLDADGQMTSGYIVDIAEEGNLLAVSGDVAPAGEDATESSRAADGSDPAAYAAELTEQVGMPVSIISEEAPESLSRQNDASPWMGGAATKAPTFCSSSFAWQRGTTYYLSTAWHCPGGPGSTVTDGAGQKIGENFFSNNDVNKSYDIKAIKVTSGSARGRIYDLGWSSSVSKAIGGSGSSYYGKKACTSGATSGSHCGMLIFATNSIATYGTQRVVGLHRARYSSNNVAVAKGDSGGPVFSSYNGSYVKLAAVGIISGGYGTVPCGSTINPNTTTTCYKEVMYQPIKPFRDQFGATLMTS